MEKIKDLVVDYSEKNQSRCGPEDKIHLETQVRKDLCKRNSHPSKERWTEFEIKQVIGTILPRTNISINKIAEYIYHNISCRPTGHTFAERHVPESQLGHSINGIKFIIEQSIRFICNRTNKTEHGFIELSPALRKLFETGEFDNYARGWLYKLAAERFDHSSTVIEEIVVNVKGKK